MSCSLTESGTAALSTMVGSVLLIEDDAACLGLFARFLEGRNLSVFQARTGHGGMLMYEQCTPDVVLLDLGLPDTSGLSLLEQLRAHGATVVVVTGQGDVETAVEAMRLGAEHFLAKPVKLAEVESAVANALETARLKRPPEYGSEAEGHWPLAALGNSPRMRELAAFVGRVAAAGGTTVLLLGENGTGKGWLARRIHELSPRRAGPFVEINCATLSGALLESELFGHEKGAFTDAKITKRGLFEVADTGTIFLDEISELDPGLQPRLLNALESHRFRRVGGTREIAVDVLVIAASNADLAGAVADQRFRADLFYRLNVLPVQLPPLRERSPSDIAELARRMVADLPQELPRSPYRLSAAALECLVRHEWPGNVRELRNVLERAAVVAGDAEVLEPEHLPPGIRSLRERHKRPEQFPSLRSLEQRHIEQALLYCKGNRSEAAKLLGISRTTLYAKLRAYGLRTVEREGT